LSYVGRRCRLASAVHLEEYDRRGLVRRDT
jgi:hypothetical protein